MEEGLFWDFLDVPQISGGFCSPTTAASSYSFIDHSADRPGPLVLKPLTPNFLDLLLESTGQVLKIHPIGIFPVTLLCSYINFRSC